MPDPVKELKRLLAEATPERSKSVTWPTPKICALQTAAVNALPLLLEIRRVAQRLDILQRENSLYSREHLAEAWRHLRTALAALKEE